MKRGGEPMRHFAYRMRWCVALMVLASCQQEQVPTNESTDSRTGEIVGVYDGDTCTTITKEKIRLACLDTPELIGNRADPIPAKAARDYLNGLVAGEKVAIRRITKDRYGRTVAEISRDEVNIQQRLVEKGFARVYKRYANQCPWSQ